MENSQLWYLESFDVTAILCPKKQAEPGRMQHFPNVFFKKGETIYFPADLADRIFLIDSGRVKIVETNELGKEITKAILDPGEVLVKWPFCHPKTCAASPRWPSRKRAAASSRWAKCAA